MVASFDCYLLRPFTLLLTVLTIFVDFSNTQDKRSEKNGFSTFLEGLLHDDKIFQGCTLQIFSYNYKSTEGKWIDKLTFLAANSHALRSNGLTVSIIKGAANIDIDYSAENHYHYEQPKTIQHSRRCAVVIMIMNTESLSNEEALDSLKSATIFPFLRPSTIRNRDKYLILTEDLKLKSLFSSKFIKSLKFKLAMVLENTENCDATKLTCLDYQVSVKRFCQYGICTKESFTETVDLTAPNILTSVGILFPDHEKNYFGHKLRLSATTKAPELLELVIVEGDNGEKVYTPERGLYAKVLEELSSKLNFTYEIFPSSGGGSTGRFLPNGTVVGTVGDTYSGIVDFGFMVATTYQRFPFAEFCAPINFAYQGFAIGPPKKSYTWKAVVWPFNMSMWLCVILTVLISAKMLSFTWNADYSNLILEESDEAMRVRNRISYVGGIALTMRGLLEQCPDLPASVSSREAFKMFFICSLLFSLVCSTLYRSKMVSLLTFPVYERVPGTFDELATATDFAVDFHYFGNVGFAYFKSSTNPSFVKILRRMGKEPSPLKCLQHTLTDKAACIIFMAAFQELLHRNLSDQYGQSPLKFIPNYGAFFPAGVIHQYKAPLSINFKSILYSAMETGLLPLWQQDDLNSILENKNRWQKANKIDGNALWGEERNEGDTPALQTRNLQGAFLILVVGLAVSVIAFFKELTKRCICRLMLLCFPPKLTKVATLSM